MTENNGMQSRRDPDLFNRNRGEFPQDELLKYTDEWVAWNLDGSRILAHDRDLKRLSDEMESLGLDPEVTVVEWIPPGGDAVTLL